MTRADSQVRITAQLIEPFADELLWSDAFTRPVSDVLTLQNQVAHDIAQHVAVTIRPEKSSGSRRAPGSPEVVEAYIRGLAWTCARSARSSKPLPHSIPRFNWIADMQVVFGLADTYAVQASLGFVRARDGYSQARDKAVTALKLDPGLPSHTHRSAV